MPTRRENLVDDGTHLFQYDGLNRPVQVNEREVDPPTEPVEFDSNR